MAPSRRSTCTTSRAIPCRCPSSWRPINQEWISCFGSTGSAIKVASNQHTSPSCWPVCARSRLPWRLSSEKPCRRHPPRCGWPSGTIDSPQPPNGARPVPGGHVARSARQNRSSARPSSRSALTSRSPRGVHHLLDRLDFVELAQVEQQIPGRGLRQHVYVPVIPQNLVGEVAVPAMNLLHERVVEARHHDHQLRLLGGQRGGGLPAQGALLVYHVEHGEGAVEGQGAIAGDGDVDRPVEGSPLGRLLGANQGHVDLGVYD